MSSDQATDARRLRQLAARCHRAAKAVRIPLRHRYGYWRYYTGLARRGVMVHSPDRDAVYADGYWRRGYDRYREAIDARLRSVTTPPPDVEIPIFAHGELGIPELQLLMRLQVPFVIRDGARELPIRNWTLDYLEQVAGTAPVPINEAPDRPADDLSRPTKAHHYYDFRRGTLGEVIDGIRQGRNLRTTTAEDVMHHDGGRLRQDLGLDYWEQVSGWAQNRHHWLRSRLMVGRIVGAQLLLQPEGAFTLWHTEPGDNFFVLAQGHKEWTLLHPYYTAALWPRVKSTTNYHGSSVDIRESEDVLRRRGYAGYLNVPKVRFAMGPGDVLRLPNHWWHTVVTRPGSYTVGVSIRAIGSFNLTCPGYTILRNLDRQYHEMARAFARDGRIHDGLIGYPRQPRGGRREPA